MTDNTQSKALRLADALDGNARTNWTREEAATELRRLHQSEREGWRHASELEQERKRLRSENEELRTQLEAAPLMGAAGDAGWVSLPGTLPEPGKPVLLDIGKKHPIRAMWAAKHTLEAFADSDWGDYYEATDTYYCPEGWYECNEYEEVHWRVTSTPVAWCALPAHSSAKGVAL